MVNKLPEAIKHSTFGCVVCQLGIEFFTYHEHGKPLQFIPNIKQVCKNGCMYKPVDDKRITCANFKKSSDRYLYESPEGFDESLKAYKENLEK